MDSSNTTIFGSYYRNGSYNGGHNYNLSPTHWTVADMYTFVRIEFRNCWSNVFVILLHQSFSGNALKKKFIDKLPVPQLLQEDYSVQSVGYIRTMLSITALYEPHVPKYVTFQNLTSVGPAFPKTGLRTAYGLKYYFIFKRSHVK